MHDRNDQQNGQPHGKSIIGSRISSLRAPAEFISKKKEIVTMPPSGHSSSHHSSSHHSSHSSSHHSSYSSSRSHSSYSSHSSHSTSHHSPSVIAARGNYRSNTVHHRTRTSQPYGWNNATHGSVGHFFGASHDYDYYPQAWTAPDGKYFEEGYYDENGQHYDNMVMVGAETMLTCTYC